MTPPIGIRDGVSIADYLRISALTHWRISTVLQQSAFHAKWAPPSDPSQVSDIGIAIHDALLEGVDKIEEIDAPDYRTKAAKEARDDARKNYRIPILKEKAFRVKEAVASAKEYISRTEFAGIWTRGKPEQTVVWEADGLICKARPDFLADDRSVLLHVKTTNGSAEPASWIRNQLTNNGYDLAWVHYMRGIPVQNSVFLVIEQGEPYGCSLVGLSPAMQELAERRYARGLAIWSECERTKRYPGYPTQVAYAEPKPWELMAEEEAQMLAEIDPIQSREGIQA